MKAKKLFKRIALALVIIVAILLLAYWGAVALMKKMERSFSCERFNIDNVELITATNIPDIADVTCNVVQDGNKKIKTNIFHISNTVDLPHYISINHFRKTSVNQLPSFKYKNDWNLLIRDSLTMHSLYIKKDVFNPENLHFDYILILDSNTKALWVEIIKNQKIDK